MIQPDMILQERYRVVKALGKGGFSQTFEVKDGGTLKVLKVLNLDDCSDTEIKEKVISLFQREAEVLERLHHSGIPRGEPQGYFTFRPKGRLEPYHCLVMEKIEGATLQEWMKSRGNQAISQNQALIWLKELVAILQEVHQQQYFHRDIKPSNIMLRSSGELVLIDFGTVRAVSDTYLGKISGGREGTQIISSGYTPPEQADGQAVPQSDFYAIARTFVYLLTGKSPLEFPKNSQTGELIWRDSASQIEPAVADLIDCLMAPFPGQRPPNARVILQRLEAIVENPAAAAPSEVVEIQLQNPQLSHARWLRFIPNNLKWTALFLLVSGSNLWIASPQIAVALNQNGHQHYLQKEYKVAEWFFRVSLVLQSGMGIARYNLGASCEKQKNYECARHEYRIAAKDSDDSAAALSLNNLGRLSIVEDRDYDAAIQWLLQGLERAKTPDLQSDLHKNLGWAYLEKSNAAKAEPHLEKAIALKRENAPAHCLLAQVRSQLGNKTGALVEWENCLTVGESDRRPEVEAWREQARQQLEQKSAGGFKPPTR